jgi:hypothetical protein
MRNRLDGQAPSMRFHTFKMATMCCDVSACPEDGSLGTSRLLLSSHYVRAKLIYLTKSSQTVISSGPGNLKCEAVLLHYLNVLDFQACSHDDLNISVFVAIGWLHDSTKSPLIGGSSLHNVIQSCSIPSSLQSSWPDTSLDLHLKILLQMRDAASTLATRPTSRIAVGDFPDDADWLYALGAWLAHAEYHLAPSNRCASREVVHVFERVYANGRLHGNPRAIRTYLHRCLVLAHKDVAEGQEDAGCATEDRCQWRGHTCDGEWSGCTLLPYPDVAGRSNGALL